MQSWHFGSLCVARRHRDKGVENIPRSALFHRGHEVVVHADDVPPRRREWPHDRVGDGVGVTKNRTRVTLRVQPGMCVRYGAWVDGVPPAANKPERGSLREGMDVADVCHQIIARKPTVFVVRRKQAGWQPCVRFPEVQNFLGSTHSRPTALFKACTRQKPPCWISVWCPLSRTSYGCAKPDSGRMSPARLMKVAALRRSAADKACIEKKAGSVRA